MALMIAGFGPIGAALRRSRALLLPLSRWRPSLKREA